MSTLPNYDDKEYVNYGVYVYTTVPREKLFLGKLSYSAESKGVVIFYFRKDYFYINRGKFG